MCSSKCNEIVDISARKVSNGWIIITELQEKCPTTGDIVDFEVVEEICSDYAEVLRRLQEFA